MASCEKMDHSVEDLELDDQGVLPVNYRDFLLRDRRNWVYVSMFLHSSSAQPHGETVEDKVGLVRVRLENQIDVQRDCLVMVTFGTSIEVHWWKCRPQRSQCLFPSFKPTGGSLTRLFKTDLAVDNEKTYFRHYLSRVKGCWENGGDICSLELKSTE